MGRYLGKVMVAGPNPASLIFILQNIFVGDKEREKYSNLNEKTFTDLGAKIIFESGLTRVYKLY